MIATLRTQRMLLNDLMLQLSKQDELDNGSRLLYDQVTKSIEQHLKELKKLRRQNLS